MAAEFEDDGSTKQETIKPMVDGGTEGFRGHARVILPGFTPCFECTLWLFPPQTKFPLCTLAETPRWGSACVCVCKQRQFLDSRLEPSRGAGTCPIQRVHHTLLC